MNTQETTTATVDAATDPHRTGPTHRSTLRTWQRRLLAGLLAVHGVAHLVGTSEAVGAISDDGSVSSLFDRWELTGTPILVAAAIVWTLVAVGFVATAVGAWADTPRWPTAVRVLASVSLALCVIGLAPTAIGLIVNAGLLAFAMWLAEPDGRTESFDN
jgi:hypothetical protein